MARLLLEFAMGGEDTVRQRTKKPGRPGPESGPAGRDWLRLDPVVAVERITEAVRTQVGDLLRRRGLVVGMSGGVDSSVCAALAARAVWPKRVFALFMPERDSDPASLELARGLADQLGVPYHV